MVDEKLIIAELVKAVKEKKNYIRASAKAVM